MTHTKLLFLEDMQMLTSEAIVLEVTEEDGKTVLILDQTCFYPQGGGQPYDQGIIQNEQAKFSVEEVRFVEGIVKHIGTFTLEGKFKFGDTVTCYVASERRHLHTRLHSAGHVIDMAVTSLGLSWTPGKGYHFPAGPYIQYTGTLEETGREELRKNIEEKCNAIIREGQETSIRFMPKEKMHTVCHHVPEYLPEGKPTRVVMYGNFGVPCGGTHVKNLRDIKSISIRKIKMDHGNIQISYDVER